MLNPVAEVSQTIMFTGWLFDMVVEVETKVAFVA